MDQIPFADLNSDKIRDKIETREVPLGSIEDICKENAITFVRIGDEIHHIGMPEHRIEREQKYHFEPFRFFNRCMCRETEKRN